MSDSRVRWRLALALISLLVLTNGSAASQVVAKQGVPDPERIQSFHSPMILEFPATEFIQPASGTAWRLRGIERFSCDGTYFGFVSLERSGKVKNGLSLRIDGTLVVGPSFDREAKVIVELLVDGQSIGRGWKENIDAEERKVKPFHFSFRLSPEASLRLEQSKNTVVRVTLFVWET